MAMKRISDLTAAGGALAGTELLEIETAGGVSQKVTAQAIADLAGAAVAPAGFQFAAETGSTADAAPGDGKVTWNHATQASATILYIDDDTVDAISLSDLWANLTAGGFLFLHAPSDATKWQAWKVTNVNDATGYAKLTVTLLAKGADFADGDALRVGVGNGAAGGGGGGGAWFVQFAPRHNEPPATNYATLDTRNSRPVLDFDTTTQESAVFSGVLPNDYAGGGVTIDIFCALTSATTGTVGWDVAFERTQASTDDIDSDSFATAQTVTAVTVPGTSGFVLKMSVNVSDGASMDSLAAGELFRLRVRRDVANDTATGDAELLAVTIRGQ